MNTVLPLVLLPSILLTSALPLLLFPTQVALVTYVLSFPFRSLRILFLCPGPFSSFTTYIHTHPHIYTCLKTKTYGLHMRKNMQYLSFWASVTCLITSRSIHSPCKCRGFIFPFSEQNFSVYMCHLFFIHSSADRQLDTSSSWLLWIMRQWAEMCKSLSDKTYSPLTIICLRVISFL